MLVAVPFTGRARSVLLGFKFHNRRAVAGHLAGLVRRRLAQAGVRPGIDIDVVTWAPTGDARRRQRGFDQAELIARHLARQLGLPCRRLLTREEHSGPQTGRSRSERLQAPGFRARLDRLIERLQSARNGRPPDPMRELCADLVERGELTSSGAKRIIELYVAQQRAAKEKSS